MRLRNTFLWTMIIAFALAAAMGIVAIIFESWWRVDEEIMVTALLVGVFSLTAMACSIVLDKKRCVALAWLGVVSSVLAMGIWVVCVWYPIWRLSNPVEELIWKSGATFTVFSVWCPHLGLLALLRLDRNRFRLVRRVTTVVATVLAALVMLAFWIEEDGEVMLKSIAVLAILGSCGTIVTPILAIVERLGRTDADGGLETRIIVHLRCPRCGQDQDLRTGTSHCAACGLRITLDVEEPRCPCGYLLYQLEGDVCPECGRPIAGEKRTHDEAHRGSSPEASPPVSGGCPDSGDAGESEPPCV